MLPSGDYYAVWLRLVHSLPAHEYHDVKEIIRLNFLNSVKYFSWNARMYIFSLITFHHDWIVLIMLGANEKKVNMTFNYLSLYCSWLCMTAAWRARNTENHYIGRVLDLRNLCGNSEGQKSYCLYALWYWHGKGEQLQGRFRETK